MTNDVKERPVTDREQMKLVAGYGMRPTRNKKERSTEGYIDIYVNGRPPERVCEIPVGVIDNGFSGTEADRTRTDWWKARILACVNALSGTPTDKLEGVDITRLLAEHAELQRRHEDVLKVLRIDEVLQTNGYTEEAVRVLAEHGIHYDRRKTIEQWARDARRAALAVVENRSEAWHGGVYAVATR